MDYKVTKVEARTVNKQGQNLGKKYAVCTVQPIMKDDQGNELLGQAREVPVFDAEAAPYLACIAIAKGGTAQQDTPIPENMCTWRYCFDEDFAFPELMVRVNDQGQPETNKFGQNRTRSVVKVFTRYMLDEQLLMLNPNGSALTPLRGWDKVTRGTSVMNSFYMPARLFNAPANTDDSAV